MTELFDRHSDDKTSILRQILHDMTEAGWLTLAPGERLWKVWVFRPAAGRASHLEHYIYTIETVTGHLALITFATHRPAAGQVVRSGIARVPDISPDALDHIIESILHQAGIGQDDYDLLDLSHLPTLPDQLAHLRILAGRLAELPGSER